MGFKDELKILDDQLYLWLGNYLSVIPKNQSEVISPSFFVKKIIIIIKEFTKDFLTLFVLSKCNLKNKNIAFVETLNNIESLKFLSKNVIYISPKKNKFEQKELIINVIIPKFKVLYDFKFLAFTIWLFLSSTKANRVKYFSKYEILFKAYGLVNEYVRLLKKNKPNKIIFTNDHNIYSRGLMIAANILRIKTIYIQHASVSTYFPSLDFDLSLLDGKDSLNKYMKITKEIKRIELIGIPKFDDYISLTNKSLSVKSIGICYNLNDSLNDVLTFRKKIENDFSNIKIILRAHPNDNRLKKNSRFLISNSKMENAFVFLQNVDLIVSGDSSIHLEAVMMNVVSLYFNFSKNEMDDYYGYVKNGLVSKYENYSFLKRRIEEEVILKSQVQNNAKYYNNAIDSKFYGKSKELAINYIEKFQ